MTTLWGELKRRNVVRVGIAYVIVGWLLLQLADVLGDLLQLPDWAGKLVVFLLVLGFPIALIFAWAFELTPEGLKRERDVDREKSVTRVTGRKLDRTIIALLALALVFVVVDNYVLKDVPQHPDVQPVVEAQAEQSIAVLPFVNMSSDQEQEYFADGLSEEILNLLARIPDLKVIGRTSSFSFKGKNEDLRVIGETLGAKTILEGSVRKSGSRIRITAQLIDAADGAHLWSDTYDRTIEDVFAVQDEVAAAIIEALHVHVGTMPTRGVPTENAEAYSLYLRARAEFNLLEVISAAPLLEQAIELDPEFAEAHEFLAFTYWWLGGVTMDAQEAFRKMRRVARTALDLNPDSVIAEALYVMGDMDDYSFLGEIEALERVVRARPSDVLGYDALIYSLLQAGYFAEGLEYTKKLVELDPLSSGAHMRLGEALIANEDLDGATQAFTTALELGGLIANSQLGSLWLAAEQPDKALAHFEDYWRWYGDDTDVSWVKSYNQRASDPETGAAYIDTANPEIVARFPEEYQYDAQRVLMMSHLEFGHLDRFYELILSPEELAKDLWEVDTHIYYGTIWRQSGFTAHSRYEELAELNGLFEVWEALGAPDMCEQVAGEWECH